MGAPLSARKTSYFTTTIVTNLANWLANLPLSIRVQTTLLACMFHPMPFPARALKKKKHFLWRWNRSKKQIEMWFSMVCTFIGNDTRHRNGSKFHGWASWRSTPFLTTLQLTILPARDYPPCPARKISPKAMTYFLCLLWQNGALPESHADPLTKFVRPKWLDIGLVPFFAC